MDIGSASLPVEGAGDLQRRAEEVQRRYRELEVQERRHPLWRSQLLQAFSAGRLTGEDLRFLFGQYYFYSREFTRFLASLMARSDDDLLRARLSGNLWEEGGGCAPEDRHSELFRRFLRDGLGIAQPEATVAEPCTRAFVQDYLRYCDEADPVAVCAFIALGTESIVPRLYALFLEGLRRARIPEAQLTFFKLHVACDDAHAQTLADLLQSYAGRPDWALRCEQGMTRALDLRETFFRELYERLQQRRLEPILDPIQRRTSLAKPGAASSLHHRPGAAGTPLYRNEHRKLNIDFEVDRLPFSAEVLDSRIVRIPPGKNNERHRHAHESVFHILQGSGQVLVDNEVIAVAPGDTVFVPRWCFHQSQNTGSEPMVILAITDFGLTGRTFIGDYHRTARMKRSDVL